MSSKTSRVNTTGNGRTAVQPRHKKFQSVTGKLAWTQPSASISIEAGTRSLGSMHRILIPLTLMTRRMSLKCRIVPMKRRIVPMKRRIVPMKRRIVPIKCRIVPIKCRIVPTKCRIMSKNGLKINPDVSSVVSEIRSVIDAARNNAARTFKKIDERAW